MSSAAESPTIEVPRASGPRAWLREHRGTLLLCIAALGIAAQQAGALFLALPAVIVPLWWIVAFVIACWRRKGLRALMHKTLLLAGAAAGCVALQDRVERVARDRGEAALRAVTAYHAAHGAWPESLEEAGFAQPPKAGLRERIMYSHDVSTGAGSVPDCPPGGGPPRPPEHIPLPPDTPPSLSYIAPTSMLDAWIYDFTKHAWVYFAD